MSFSKQEKHFLNSASASVILPQNNQLPLTEALQDDVAETTLQDIQQRDTLFFDERLTVYVVLHVLQCPEEELKSYLSRLNLSIEVWATSGTQTSDRSPGTTAARDLIFSDTIKRTEDPIVLISQNEDEETIYLNLMWETSVILNRPRIRLEDTRVTFCPIALVAPLEEPTSSEIYLEPFQPQAGNLFEPLRGSRGYEIQTPYLPISRLESILPLPPKDNHTFHLASVPSQTLPIYSAFVTRLRCSKLNVIDTIPTMIASVDLEMIPFVQVRGRISAAEATLQKGKVRHIMGNMLPIDCQSRDCVTFLYQLEEGTGVDQSFKAGSSIQIDVLALTIKVELQLSDECQPVIQMNWTSNVDFAQTTNNTPGPPTYRPSGAPNAYDSTYPTLSQNTSISLQSMSQSNGSKGITVSFASTDSLVKIGVPFSWRVLIVNRTNKNAKLAIIPLPRTPKQTSQAQQYAKRHATRSSITSLHPGEKIGNGKPQSDIAQAVMDENIIYAMHHSGVVPPETDLMSLTPELRVGPLGPGQCHEAEIKLVAFRSGAFTLDAVRVVDLVKEAEQGYGSPGVVMDIRELPDVVVDEDSTDSRE